MYGSSLVGGRGYTEGNCTWYAHGRVLELGGNLAALRTMYGNANEWHTQISNGTQIVSNPQSGDIAQWTRWYTDSNGQRRQMNHVAVVEKVNSDGTIVISESHYETNWDGGGSGTLHNVRTISASNPDRFIRVPGVQVQDGTPANSSPVIGTIRTGGQGIDPESLSRFEAAKTEAIQRLWNDKQIDAMSWGEPSEITWLAAADGEGLYQQFGDNALLMMQTDSDKAYWIRGDNYQEYMTVVNHATDDWYERHLGFSHLGFPWNDETDFISSSTGATGIWQGFSGFGGKSRIHSSWTQDDQYLGSVATWGAIGARYDALGGASSEWGLPVTAELNDPDGVTIWAEFEDATVAYNRHTDEFAINQEPHWLEEPVFDDDKWLNDKTELTEDQENKFKSEILKGDYLPIKNYDFLKEASQSKIGELHSLSGLRLVDSDTLGKGFLNKDGTLFELFGYLDILKKKLGQISLRKAIDSYELVGNAIDDYPFNDQAFENRVYNNSLKIAESYYPALDEITEYYKSKYSFDFFDSLKNTINMVGRAVGLGLHFSMIFIEIKASFGKSAVVSKFNNLSHEQVFGSDSISQANVAEVLKDNFDKVKALYESLEDIQNAIVAVKERDFEKMFDIIPKLVILLGDLQGGTLSAEFIKAAKATEDLGNLHRLLGSLNSLSSEHITSDDIDFVYWARVYAGFTTLVSTVKTMNEIFKKFLGNHSYAAPGVEKVTGYLDAVANIADSIKGSAWALFEQWNSTELRRQNAIYSYLNDYYHSFVGMNYDIISYVAKETIARL